MTIRMRIDPNNVYKKNLMEAYSLRGPPQIAMRKNIGNNINSKKR
jgi:hypothetical protein